MKAEIRELVKACTRASDEGKENFGAIVTRLMQAGVERYHADLLRSEKVYYLPDGESELVGNDPVGDVPAETFSAAGVQAAVKAAQAGEFAYKTFCERVMAAGCAGYIVSLAGKRVIYYGRTGDMHVEWFPGAK